MTSAAAIITALSYIRRMVTPMSVEQLEQQIQQLPPADLVRPAEWSNRLLASRTPADAAAEPEWEETLELVAELERRLAEFRANPAIAVPFEP